MSMNAKDAIAYTVKSRDDRRRFMPGAFMYSVCLTIIRHRRSGLAFNGLADHHATNLGFEICYNAYGNAAAVRRSCFDLLPLIVCKHVPKVHAFRDFSGWNDVPVEDGGL